MPYRYDQRLHNGRGGYRDNRGRIVPMSRVRKAIFNFMDKGGDEAKALTQLLLDDAISLPQWKESMRQVIKDGHLISYAVQKGGWEQMTPADYGRVGSIVKGHYQKLDNWSYQLAAGIAPRDGRALNRARMYEAAFYSTYAQLEHGDAAAAGMTEERTILDPSAENCWECIEQADLGWQPLGTLTPIGERACMVADRCGWDFR